MLNTPAQWLCITALGLLAAPALAQNPPAWPQGQFTPYVLDSGKISNTERDSSVVFEKTITVEDAVWMRLYFTDASLRPGSYVRMTSRFDGEIQELDAADLAMWNYTSAYFNGDSVHLELIAAPGSFGNRIALDQVAVHIVQGGLGGDCYPNDKGICGNDDRVPSDELWAARLMPGGCTASIYNTASCAVTAGHCTGNDVLHFDVPDSHPVNCDTFNPPVADQFPVTGYESKVYQPTFEDWAVMTVGANNLGETPYERYGVYRPIASEPPSPGSAVEIWSYGTDNGDPIWNQTQQYSAGVIVGYADFFFEHDADITWGSSGGALLHNDEIIGISSLLDYHCRNLANRIDIPEYVAARETLCTAGCPIALFAGCMSGPGQPLAPECEPADIDGDNDADLADFAAYQVAFGGP